MCFQLSIEKSAKRYNPPLSGIKYNRGCVKTPFHFELNEAKNLVKVTAIVYKFIRKWRGSFMNEFKIITIVTHKRKDRNDFSGENSNALQLKV